MSDHVVAVAGVGVRPFGRFDGASLVDLGVPAVRAALEDAGVGRGGFQAAYCATAYGGVATGHRVLGALALTGVPIVDVEAGCASGAAALAMAARDVTAGVYDCVLVLGVEKMPRGMIRSSYFAPWQEEAGLTPAPGYFALRAQRLCHEAGLTKAHLAEVVVRNRRHGAANPAAMYRREVTADEVLASRLVCEPLHLWMLCSPNEGAAAVVLRRGRSSGGVRLRAAVLRSHLPGGVLAESTPLAGIDDAGIPSASALAAADAYAAAGVGPEDVDVVECQDTDAARELLAYEELGLCPPGGQGRFLSDGTVAVNRSGGLLSKGEPLGASALAQVIELVHQLRGAAGARQVDRARMALAHTVGRGANAGVVILSRT